MSKSYKMVEVKGTLAGALEGAYSEIQTLHEELEEMEGNMSNANMEHLPKYEVVTNAINELENHTECPDIPEPLQELPMVYHEMVNKRRGRGPSRDVRMSNATAAIQAVVAVLDELTEGDKENEDADHQLRQEIDEAADLCPEFPGMFG